MEHNILPSNNSSQVNILVDGREFVAGRRTGISRFLEGLLDALVDSDIPARVVLAAPSEDAVPHALRQKINVTEVPAKFITSERILSKLTKKAVGLFISPYSKLPLFGNCCPAIHTIHDILYLTHPTCRSRIKFLFDRRRLVSALKRSSLTWYDSEWSLKETLKYAGTTGKNPRVRHLAVGEIFTEAPSASDGQVIQKYQLSPGYIIVLGNGLPHKNLDVLLAITREIKRQLVFVGVRQETQTYWRSRYPGAKARWISHVNDADLPALLRGAFCLLQPSLCEGYGYPPLEAMACGRPAVVSSIPVLIETTGGCAMTADPNEPKAWLDAIQRLENKEFYLTQISRGLEWVRPQRGRKAWRRHIADMEELLEGIRR
jgi:glycosyltransferase involved in cell wall biosynthesis